MQLPVKCIFIFYIENNDYVIFIKSHNQSLSMNTIDFQILFIKYVKIYKTE